MRCPHCEKSTAAGLVCSHCGGILPPGGDKFAQLGVPRRYDLASTELESRYRELNRKLHPDRFAKADARDRLLSLKAATALNEAYRTLKTPVGRAEYLLELHGHKLDEGDAVDPDFLMEILELRERLAEAKLEGDAVTLATLGAEMRTRHDAAMKALSELFARVAEDPAALAMIREQLIALRYYQRFLDEHAGEDAD